MTERARSAYEEWNSADAKARDAEVTLARSWQDYFDGRGTPPGDELIHEVSRLRATANERLSAAMTAINDGSKRTGDKPR